MWNIRTFHARDSITQLEGLGRDSRGIFLARLLHGGGGHRKVKYIGSDRFRPTNSVHARTTRQHDFPTPPRPCTVGRNFTKSMAAWGPSTGLPNRTTGMPRITNMLYFLLRSSICIPQNAPRENQGHVLTPACFPLGRTRNAAHVAQSRGPTMRVFKGTFLEQERTKRVDGIPNEGPNNLPVTYQKTREDADVGN